MSARGKRPSSGFRGVSLTTNGKWQTNISHLGRQKSGGVFPSAEAAGKAYDRAFYKLRGDSSGPNFGPLTAAEMAEVNGLTEAQLFPRKRKTSTYRGVSFHKQTGRFTAFINANRVMRYLGTFDDEIAAARAYDEEARRVFGAKAKKLNFPDDDDGPLVDVSGDESDGESDNDSDWAGDDEPGHAAEPRMRRRAGKTSAYRGVCRAPGKFQAQVWANGMNNHLGIFDGEEAAALAYDKAARELHGDKAILNFPDVGGGLTPAALPAVGLEALRFPAASHGSDMGVVAPDFSKPTSPPAPLLAPPAAEPQRLCPALTAADLPPPPLWLFRAPASGEVMGPFLISALRRSVQAGDITARDARLLRVWRQGEPEAASTSLELALALPMLRSRSLQLELLRTRRAVL